MNNTAYVLAALDRKNDMRPKSVGIFSERWPTQNLRDYVLVEVFHVVDTDYEKAREHAMRQLRGNPHDAWAYALLDKRTSSPKKGDVVRTGVKL